MSQLWVQVDTSNWWYRDSDDKAWVQGIGGIPQPLPFPEGENK